MVDKGNIPKHIAIIMDGNGRWAKSRRLPRTAGHHEGIKRAKEIIKAASANKIQVLTLFAFSNENWARPKPEIRMLMHSLVLFLNKEIREMEKNNVKFMVIGKERPLPRNVIAKLHEAEERTRNNSGLKVVIALNYGSRQEIVDAAKRFAHEVREGKLSAEGLDEEAFSKYLYTAGLPDPDLLIRTSGEMRISNFLLWQLSYAELYFPQKFWPEFKAADLEMAIEEYQKRERRFGRL